MGVALSWWANWVGRESIDDSLVLRMDTPSSLAVQQDLLATSEWVLRLRARATSVSNGLCMAYSFPAGLCDTDTPLVLFPVIEVTGIPRAT